MKKILSLAIVAVLMSMAAFAASSNKDLAQVRKATAKYHDVQNALDDGFVNTMECVSNHNGPGSMGIHFVNEERLMDGEIVAQEPEVLLYYPQNDKLRLVGVEYLLPVGPSGLPEAPEVAGMPLNFMEPHDPLNFHHYELHAWVWQGNPDGIFSDYNPNLSCPE